VPAVLLSADRKPTHAVRRAHDQMAQAIGARIVTWPGAVHAEHYRSPQQVVDLVLGVLDEVQRN
jgi:hypothetical protein